MPYTGWLSVGATTIVDDARALAHARYEGLGAVDVEGAEYLPAYTGGSYDGPVSAADPWWSAHPAAGRFLGIIGTAFSGLESNPQARAITASANEGGTLAAAVAAPREITVTMLLLAADTTGLNYGFEWLSSVLQQRDAQPYDAGTEQAQLAAVTLPGRWGGPQRPGAMAAPLRFLAAEPQDAPGDAAYARTLYDVALSDGPDVVATYELSTGGCQAGAQNPVAAEVSFTLTAARPWLWLPPGQLGYTGLVAWPDDYGTSGNPWTEATGLPVKWVMYRDTGALTPRGQDPLDLACSQGSGCPPARTLPRAAPDLDWCAATLPTVPRWGGLPDLKDAGLIGPYEYAPIVVIETGSDAMRRASFRISRRLPGGFHDPASLLVRHELNVPYLPAGSRAILDGRSQTVIVDCAPAGTALAALNSIDTKPPQNAYTPAAYGIASSPITWPVFRGDEDLRLTCHAEDNFCADDARFTVFLAARQALA